MPTSTAEQQRRLREIGKRLAQTPYDFGGWASQGDVRWLLDRLAEAQARIADLEAQLRQATHFLEADPTGTDRARRGMG